MAQKYKCQIATNRALLIARVSKPYRTEKLDCCAVRNPHQVLIE